MLRLLLLSINLLQEGNIALDFPNCPVAPKSTEITAKIPYLVMGQVEDLNVHLLERAAFSAYHKLGLDSVTVFQRELLQEPLPFNETLVPFSDEYSAIFQQLHVVKSVFWGPACLDEEEHAEEARLLKSHLEMPEQIEQTGSGKDPFCREDIVKRQTIYEGKHVRLLYPTSVLPSEEHSPHFLLVTKICRPNFLSLTEAEALEIEALSRKVFAYFKEENYEIGYGLFKSGKVGITIPHFHKHLIFFKNISDEQRAKWRMIQNIFFGSTSLPAEVFQKNRAFYQATLGEKLKN